MSKILCFEIMYFGQWALLKSTGHGNYPERDSKACSEAESWAAWDNDMGGFLTMYSIS